MTVQELIARLREFPDDAVVVLSGRDHSYREIHVAAATDVVEEGNGALSEPTGADSEELLPGVILS